MTYFTTRMRGDATLDLTPEYVQAFTEHKFCLLFELIGLNCFHQLVQDLWKLILHFYPVVAKKLVVCCLRSSLHGN